MRIVWTTLFAVNQYINNGIWKLKFDLEKNEELLIKTWDNLFKGELEREIRTQLGKNPYHFRFIPPMEINMNSDFSYSIGKDYGGFISSLINGLKGINGKKLYFKYKNHGFNTNYFALLKNGLDDYLEVNRLFSGEYLFDEFPNQNIRRLIGMLFERDYPIIKQWDNDKDILVDYSKEERKAMLKYKYQNFDNE